MQLELLGFFGIFIIALVAYAEIARQHGAGLFAALMILLMGVWVVTDGVQMFTGTVATESVTEQHTFSLAGLLNGNSSSNATSNSTFSTAIGNYTELYNENLTGTIGRTANVTTANQYADVQIPFLQFKDVFGTTLILLSLYGLLLYGKRAYDE